MGDAPDGVYYGFELHGGDLITPGECLCFRRTDGGNCDRLSSR
jgi:hypothetical protein